MLQGLLYHYCPLPHLLDEHMPALLQDCILLATFTFEATCWLPKDLETVPFSNNENSSVKGREMSQRGKILATQHEDLNLDHFTHTKETDKEHVCNPSAIEVERRGAFELSSQLI